MRLFDTHAHLDTDRFGDDDARRSAVRRAASAGIAASLIPGIEPDTWPNLLRVAAMLGAETPEVRFHTALGVHPQALPDLPEGGDHALAERLDAALAAAPPGLVAIGECGLDFGPRGQGASRERQIRVFDAHLGLARRRGLPLLIHCVDAHGVMEERLTRAPLPPSILHSFSGSPEVAAALCRAGHYISLAGALTHPRARRPHLAARAIPGDRLLLETDSPDQTPAGRRPARNEPAFLVEIATAVAALRGLPLADLAAQTTANACRALGLAPPP